MVSVIGSETLRSAEKSLDTNVLKCRHALDTFHQHRLEMVEIVRQLVKTEILRDAVHSPGLGNWLKSAQQNLAGIFLIVSPSIVVAQYRQVGRHPFEWFGNDIEMLARMQRHMDADTGCQSACPHAARQHHVLSANFALIRHYADGSAIFNKPRQRGCSRESARHPSSRPWPRPGKYPRDQPAHQMG